MNSELIDLNVELNKELLLEEANVLHGYTTFIDPITRQPVDGWKVKLVSQGYALKVTNILKYRFNIKKCQPWFYIQEPTMDVPFHVDRGTLCSFNFLLSENLDPISFRDKTVFYKNGFLNTTVEHAVLNPQSKRILFKVSIFDRRFDEIKDILPQKLFLI